MKLEHFVKAADGTSLYATSQGKGPPIVLCDGLGCDGFIWQDLAPFLAQRFRVVHWNYRGHGRSQEPHNLESLNMETLLSDLSAVLDALDVDEAILVGHSLGVQVILEFAARHPERIRALVPVCGSYGRPLTTFHNSPLLDITLPTIRKAVESYPAHAQWLWNRVFESRVLVRAAMEVETSTSMVDLKKVKPYFQHLRSMRFEVFIRMLDGVRTHTVEHRLHTIRAPALVVAGTKDTFTPGSLSRRMAHLLPEGELLMIPGGSHIAPLEQPELLRLRLEAFLAKVSPTQPKRKPKASKAAS